MRENRTYGLKKGPLARALRTAGWGLLNQITGATDAGGGGEVLEPPRPQGAETVSRGPGSNGRASRENRQAAVTPRPDPWASLYHGPDCRHGPAGAHDLDAHVCERPRARADNPDHGRGSERRLDLGCGNLGWSARRSVGTERNRTKPSSVSDDDFG